MNDFESEYERRLEPEWDRDVMELSATDQWLHDDALTQIIRQLIYSDRMIHSICKYMFCIRAHTHKHARTQTHSYNIDKYTCVYK